MTASLPEAYAAILAGLPALPAGADASGELAAVAAAILYSGEGAAGLAGVWSEATGQPVAMFPQAAGRGRRFETELLAGMAALADDPEAARRYGAAIADLAAAAAAVEPVDLRRVNAAAFIASRQLRSVPPVVSATAGTQLSVHGPDPVSSALALLRPDDDRAEVAEPATSQAESEARAESAAEEPPQPSYEELLAQLDELVGLAEVKSEVRQQAELLRVTKLRADRGLKNPDISRHLVFTGNPGTGKTTVARLVAQLYRSLGLLEKGHLVEIDRSGLVGGYLGQTELKTAEVVKSALGGVLFIDEAYSLEGDQYGQTATDTLVKAIEDHRDDFVLIVAGYTGPMAEFIESNPGLASRLRLTIEFPDYSDDELVEIFNGLAERSDYEPDPGCADTLRGLLAAEPRGEAFGNARFVRNLFEAALVRQAWRLRDEPDPTTEQLRELLPADLA